MALAEPLSKKTGKMEASDDDRDKNLPDLSTEESQNSEANDKEENVNLCELSTERSQKRELSDLQDDENSLDSESETPSSSKIRKTHLPLTSSDYTTGNESEEELDLSCSGEEGVNDSVGNWEYKDLLGLNICYKETPESLENFIQEVKDAFLNRKGFCPDCSEVTRSLKRHLEESLTFSYDLRKIKDLAYTSVDYREDELKKVHREMEEIVKKMWRNSENMQSNRQ
ncbi:uncharacterized protein LOC133179914 [Saccostrea echinata]|uniref:uncharacterized protein LOC133179914 n=1 Tax=Saccostrea echinata TaxID=191078 RepID=UPI002A8312A9|nr:uncharacterized protein LOC133179914 [Saccostrea echinata]